MSDKTEYAAIEGMNDAKPTSGCTGASPCSIPAICAAWLIENGYDGLCDPTMECGCSVIDLMPCDRPSLNECVPAHKELQDDGDWLMFPGRSNATQGIK